MTAIISFSLCWSRLRPRLWVPKKTSKLRRNSRSFFRPRCQWQKSSAFARAAGGEVVVSALSTSFEPPRVGAKLVGFFYLLFPDMFDDGSLVLRLTFKKIGMRTRRAPWDGLQKGNDSSFLFLRFFLQMEVHLLAGQQMDNFLIDFAEVLAIAW